MSPTKAQVLASIAEKLDAALIDPDVVDKRHIITQISEIVGVTPNSGSGGGGSATSPLDITAGIDASTHIDRIALSLAAIESRALSLPQTTVATLAPGASHSLPVSCAVILGLLVTYPLPKVCRLHVIANANIISVFSYRPVRFDPVWGHVVIPDRSAVLPCWVPSSPSIVNKNTQPITVQIIYQNLP